MAVKNMRERVKASAALLTFSLAINLTSPGWADGSMGKLSKQLSRSLEGNKKIAILTFPYHDGKISSGSSILSERLTTELVGKKRITVVERRLIQKLLEEQKLNETGVIDPATAKTIGSVLGVDAIVTGTLIDLEKETEINARVIHTQTGEILGVAKGVVERTWSDKPREVQAVKKEEKSPTVKKEAPPAARKLQTPAKTALVDSEPVSSGKTLRLSNDNLPAGRRYYRGPVRQPAANTYNSRESDRRYDYEYDSGYGDGYYEGRLDGMQTQSSYGSGNSSYSNSYNSKSTYGSSGSSDYGNGGYGSTYGSSGYGSGSSSSMVERNMSNFNYQKSGHLSGSSNSSYYYGR